MCHVVGLGLRYAISKIDFDGLGIVVNLCSTAVHGSTYRSQYVVGIAQCLNLAPIMVCVSLPVVRCQVYHFGRTESSEGQLQCQRVLMNSMTHYRH